MGDPRPPRDETSGERLDRNTIELLNEIRVAVTGVQVVFAFLLTVPFQNRFPKLSNFERDLYLVGLICIGITVVLLVAPSVHHRVLFRLGEKAYLIDLWTRLIIVAMAFFAIGLTAIMVLVANVVEGTVAAALIGTGAAVAATGVWFALPLRRREEDERPPDGT